MSGHNPPEPHTPEWCALNPNRCKGDDPVSVSIDDPVFISAMILLGIILILIKLKIITMKTINSLFERFYDTVSQFIGGGKSFAPNELKGFR